MLFHMTDNIENLKSILNDGIYYLYCETRIARSLAGPALDRVREFNPGGMICMTEVPISEAASFGFGRYGVGVDKAWAEAKGARRVTYLKEEGEEFLALKSLYESLRPPRPSLSDVEPDLRDFVEDTAEEFVLTKSEWARVAGANENFIGLLRASNWWETYDHAHEKEWRIRSGDNYPTVSYIETKNGPDYQFKTQQMKQLQFHHNVLGMPKSIFMLEIPATACKVITAPASRIDEIRSFALERGFGGAEFCFA